MKNFIEKATFSEIYKIVKSRGNEDLLNCFLGVFKTGLLFLPGLICPEVEAIVNLEIGINLLETSDIINNCVKNIYNFFKGNKYENYHIKYDDMVIAHFLITYAAFFDTIKQYLPNENCEIALDDNEKLFITQETIEKYKKSLKVVNDNNNEKWTNHEIFVPNPLFSFNSYLEKLNKFYGFYANEFFSFFKKLECWESMDETKKDLVSAIIRTLPAKAVENYKKQYYELSRCFRDFEVWCNQREHHSLDKKIDIGFTQINKSINELIEKSKNKIVVDILENHHKLYDDFVSRPVVTNDEIGHKSSEQITFPSKSDIFVPQQFQAISYIENTKLEKIATWNNADTQDDIGEFIDGILHHPDCRTKPLIILGQPGAGKSLLCNMLAAKILYKEYHVIIVTLRDAKADDTIVQQITDQIKRQFGESCSWYDITQSNLDKPLLIIFDGYDELLQSSGKTYSNYINKISEFQKTQLITSNIQIRCILTSRITLIDKAYIPTQTVILKLCDFDNKRIESWINIWNNHNKKYFSDNNLSEFVLPQSKKISDLAQQPLLLMMLALYDSSDNKLKKQKDLTQTQLYNNLIREFVTREKNKDDTFRNSTPENQDKKIDCEIENIGIAAIGMYNRNSYHIFSKNLNSDLKFYDNSENNRCNPPIDDELTEADTLLASFFFMHKSLSTDYEGDIKKEYAAYEFLHNTFGEFLTANFILSKINETIDWILLILQKNRTIDSNNVFSKAWYAALIYSPLFTKPVVINMLREWSGILFDKEEKNRAQIIKALDKILNYELKRIINGEIFNQLNEIINQRNNTYPQKDLLIHAAIYSINLLIIRNILATTESKIELISPLEKDTHNKLIELWKYAFDDNDLLSFSHMFSVTKQSDDTNNFIIIKYKSTNCTSETKDSFLDNLYNISSSIGDRLTQALSGCLLGDTSKSSEVIKVIESYNFNMKSHYYLSAILFEFANKKSVQNIKTLIGQLIDASLKEDNASHMIIACLLLEFLMNNDLIFINVCNPDQDFFAKQIRTMSTYCHRCRNIDNLKTIYLLKEMICQILLKDVVEDQIFLYIMENTNFLNFIFEFRFKYLSFWGLKLLNKYLALSQRNENKELFFKYKSIIFDKFRDNYLDYFIYTDYNENEVKDIHYLNMVNEYLKLLIIWTKESNLHNPLTPLNSILRKDVVSRIIQTETKDINLLTEILSNLILIIYSINTRTILNKKHNFSNYILSSIFPLLSIAKINNNNKMCDEVIYKLLKLLNIQKAPLIFEYSKLTQQLIDFIDDKQQFLPNNIVCELIQFAETNKQNAIKEKLKEYQLL